MRNYYDYNGNDGDVDYYAMYQDGRIKEARGSFSRFFLALFIYLVSSTAIVFIAQFIFIALFGQEKAIEFLDENIYMNWLLGVGPMYIVGFPILIFMVWGMKKRTREVKKMTFSRFFMLFLISNAFMIFGNLIGNSINSMISAVLGREVTNSTSELIENSPIWLVFLVTVILAPIIEELIFRKLMIDRLSRFGDALAIIVSAIAFGLFHGNLYQFFYAAMLGALLGYVYCSTGNILHTILLHVLINFSGSILVMPILEKAELLESLSERLAAGEAIDMSALISSSLIVTSYSIIQYAVAIAGAILFIQALRQRKIKLNKYCEFKIPGERVFGVTVLNVGAILFLINAFFSFAASIFLV